MKNRYGAFWGFGVCLLVALSGCDSEEYDFDDPEFAQEYRGADDLPPCGLGPDYNFKCTVAAQDLTTWAPTDMTVPSNALSSFALWTTMSTSTVPQMLTKDCGSPPPSGDHSPIQPATWVRLIPIGVRCTSVWGAPWKTCGWPPWRAVGNPIFT